MSGSLIDQYTKRPGPASESPEDEAEGTDDRGCFGWLRGIRDRAIMLELRKKDGHILAIGYAWLERVEFLPEEGITLHFTGRKVKITGSGLNSEARPNVRLLDGVVRHRVPWIREADRSEVLKAGKDAVVVESIQWDD